MKYYWFIQQYKNHFAITGANSYKRMHFANFFFEEPSFGPLIVT